MHAFLLASLGLLWGIAKSAQGLSVPHHDGLRLRANVEVIEHIAAGFDIEKRAQNSKSNDKSLSKSSAFKTTPSKTSSVPSSVITSLRSKTSSIAGTPIKSSPVTSSPKTASSALSSKASSSAATLSITKSSTPKSASTISTASVSSSPSASVCPVGSRVSRGINGQLDCKNSNVAHPTNAIDTCEYLIDCVYGSDDSPIEEDSEGSPSKPNTNKPGTTKGDPTTKTSRRRGVQVFPVNLSENDKFDARGSPRRYKSELDTTEVFIKSLAYPSNSDLFRDEEGKKINDKVSIAWSARGMGVRDAAIKMIKGTPSDTDNYVTEHLLELQTIKMFIEYVTGNNKATEKNPNPPQVPPAFKVSAQFFKDFWNKNLDQTKVKQRKSKAMGYESNTPLNPQKTLNDLVFQALGSNENRGVFVLCDKEINTYKMRFWKKWNFMNLKKFNTLLIEFKRGGEDSTTILSVFRAVFGVYKYINHERVQPRLHNAFENVKKELSNAEDLTDEKDVGQKLSVAWTLFMTEEFERYSNHGKNWLKGRYTETKKIYKESIQDIQKGMDEFDNSQTRQDVDKKTKDLKAKIEKLNTELEQLKTEIENKKKEVRESKQEIIAAEETGDKAKISSASTNLKVKKQDLNDLKAALLTNKRDIGATQRDIYKVSLADLQELKKNLEEDEKALLEYEKNTDALKLPGLGTPMSVRPGPGST
ncbi:hypothetical protein P280DRAFT_530209 [Massarina eburnea CBS 473.64]|uniref:Uncharacterized protein n=1 Tax=Massarina eburnea CBS 473.64 TaxID=1395130 RepID=A0A6A6RV39_9PLEO|nr:hypothetical protein P280DRAFT_530209 [Massarina eburnea CBS 473.64]